MTLDSRIPLLILALCFMLPSFTLAAQLRSVVVAVDATDVMWKTKRLSGDAEFDLVQVAYRLPAEAANYATWIRISPRQSKLSNIRKPDGRLHLVGMADLSDNDPLVRAITEGRDFQITFFHFRPPRSKTHFCGDFLRPSGTSRFVAGAETSDKINYELKEEAIRQIKEEDFASGLK